jgi:GT2 family glycosyltransferase
MNKHSVSIIIPNYNGKKLLEAYLPYTLAAAEHSKADYEIILVDDASKDDSVNFVRTTYPQIRVHQNPTNAGFSTTCNKGIQLASKSLILLLNSDIKLSENYFDSQWKYFEQDDTFGVMGKIIDRNPKVKDGPKLLKNLGLKFHFHHIYRNTDSDSWLPTSFLSGANALVSAKKVKQIGGFNELFAPFYYEDTELSLRAWRMGWKCYYDYQASCEHLGSSTINANHLKKNIKIIFYRNRYLVHALHLSKGQYFWFKWQILFTELIPKTLIGRFWIWKSFFALRKLNDKINQQQLANKQQEGTIAGLIPIFALRKNIIQLLKNQNIKYHG